MMNKPEFPKPRIIHEGFLLEPMTDFQPTPQTPEQVADGLRAAMKQAKEDGVFDEPIQAKVSDEDFQKIVDLMNNQEPYPDAMFEEAERREKSNRVLERYNRYYNMECAGLPHGTPITPEHQQIIAFESMIDALRCENLNHEFDVVPIADIEDLIERLREQANEYLKTVKEFKDSADGVA